MTDQELLEQARAVDKILSENPGATIEVDPDLADFMGAFIEDAITEEDARESGFITDADIEAMHEDATFAEEADV